MSHHPFAVEGLANARDLGGLTRSDGSRTPAGVFIRAEALDRVTRGGWDVLRRAGVRTVIDLRRPHEISGDVPPDIDVMRVDLDGDERSFWAPLEADGRWGTPLYYLEHLAVLPHRMLGVLDAITRARSGAVLFHCGAGWDRTGLVSAVLLKALNVTVNAAASDYLRSFDNAERMAVVHGRSFEADERRVIMSRLDHTPTSAFRSVYENLDVNAWFTHASATSEIRSAITSWRGSIDV